MEVKIGVQSVAREIVIDTPVTAEEVERALTEALADEDGVLRLTDSNGGVILVPTEKLGYVEIGESENRRVGFGAI